MCYLKFLDLLLKLSTKGLFILNLAEELAYLKVLPVLGNKEHVQCYLSDKISSCPPLTLNDSCGCAFGKKSFYLKKLSLLKDH